jgi:hypothetical protein
MTVYVVYTEWNRPHDCDGGCAIEGIAATEQGAIAIAAGAHEEHKGYGHVPYFDDETGESSDDWDYDVHTESYEVMP